MSHSDELVMVFAKAAVAGSVKTRLTPPFTPEEAAQFHLAALDDVVEIARRAVGPSLELRVAGGATAAKELQDRYPAIDVREQTGEGLGERLTEAFEDAFSTGFGSAVALGGDHPTLPPDLVRQALSRLANADVVFGPARDGGYYLVAVRESSWPAARTVFESIPWSTPAVLERSLEQARSARLQVGLLPEWYDVDEASDLERLRRDALPGSACARFFDRMRKRRL